MTEIEQDILFCVVTRLEIAKVRKIVEELDVDAFVAVHAISDASGGVVKKRMVH